MGRRCIVKLCTNNCRNPSNTVHTLPSDENVRSSWVNFADPNEEKSLVSLNNQGVCSLHFLEEDYRPLKRMRTEENVDFKARRLKDWAIPSVQPTGFNMSTECNFELVENSADQVQIDAMKSVMEEQGKKISAKSVTVKALQKEMFQLRTKIIKRDKIIADQASEISTLRKQIDSLKTEIIQLKNTPPTRIATFTDRQMRLIENKQLQYVHWTPEDYSKAIALFITSSKAYNYIRKIERLPYPSEASIHRQLSKAKIVPDQIFPAVLGLLKGEFSVASAFDRKCVLALDEMGLSAKYTLDKDEDKVYAPSSNVTVFALRGLHRSWKQPIMYSFEPASVPDLLLHIITVIKTECNLEVSAIVSDMGPQNRRWWKSFGVGNFGGEIKNTLKHPLTGEDVFVFPDFPHLLKLLRNHTLDSQIRLKNGGVVNKALLQKLIDSKAELSMTFKLTDYHLNVVGQQRQRVRPAFQVYSNTTASAIRTIVPKKSEEADFVELVNAYSDLANVRFVTNSKLPYKAEFGSQLFEQMRIVEDFEKTIRSMKVGKRKNNVFAPFQFGLLMHVKSLCGLFEKVKLPPTNGKYILTSHLNQDFLEGAFGIIRGIGAFNSNPSAPDFKNRLRKLLFSWNTHCISKASPVKHYGDNEYLSMKFMKALQNNNYETETDSYYFEEGIDSRLEVISEDFYEEERPFHILESHDKLVEGGTEYIAGYLAKKFRDSHPEMSKNENEVSREGWVSIISRGGLVEPSQEWLRQFKKLDEMFITVHGNSVCLEENVSLKLFLKIEEKFPCIPSQVVKSFVKLRLSVRLRWLNNLLAVK